jgi:hypothetical protein
MKTSPIGPSMSIEDSGTFFLIMFSVIQEL